MPTNPANRDDDPLEVVLLGGSGVEARDWNRAGVIVTSEDKEGARAWFDPFVACALCGKDISLSSAVMEGRIAVTMVAVAAPPKLKRSLARSSCGYTSLAWTKRNRASPTMANPAVETF